jgi:hypothetical protein
MTNAIKVLLQMQSGFLQLASTLVGCDIFEIRGILIFEFEYCDPAHAHKKNSMCVS